MPMLMAVIALAATTASTPATTAGTTVEKRYPIGTRGTLVLQVPGQWAEEVEPMGATLGPYIQMSGPKGPKESDFSVELFAMWSESDPQMVRREEWRTRLLESARDQDIPDPTDAERALHPIAGPHTKGASLSYTLRAPRNVAGGRRYVTNAVVVVGEIALNMTVSTDTQDSPALPAALAALTGARLVK